MKIRTGFVSNSSSSSFCIYGILLDDLDETLKHFDLEIEEKKKIGCNHTFKRNEAKFCPECGNKSWEVREIYDDEKIDKIVEMVKEKTGIEDIGYSQTDGGENIDGGYYLGISDSDINERGPQLAVDVYNALGELFEDKCELYNDVVYG